MNTDFSRDLLLRQAAGSWWLLDTAQTGNPYIPPIQLNDTGAKLWRLAGEGASPQEMAAALSGVDPPPPEALADVEAFLDALGKALKRGAPAAPEGGIPNNR